MKPNVFIASVLMAFAWTLTTALSGQPASSPSLLSDTEIRRILVDRIDVQRQSVNQPTPRLSVIVGKLVKP